MKNKNGFSLIETLTVISITSIIAIGGFLSINASRERVSVDQAQMTIVSALEEARGRAATGFGVKKHGIRIEQKKIIIFEDDSYPGAGQEIALPQDVSVTSAFPNDIIFNRISAAITGPSITIQLKHDTNPSFVKNINIASNGKIIVQ